MIPEAARAWVRETPLVFAQSLGCWLKLENLQATGSFKLRGAAVKLARMSAEARRHGVVTASAGNHGLGLAWAAAHLGVAARVVVGRNAARVKREGIARLGAEVVVEGEGYDAAERAARAFAVAEGRVFISAYDDEDVIDGNGGWLADEIAAARRWRRVVVPVGGGGMIGGIARTLAPRGVEVVGVQPRANCAMHDSLEAGRALTVYAGGATLCEGLEGAVAERTYALARAHVSDIVLVDEDELLAAIAFAYRELGLVVEPSAAVGLAAVRAGRLAVDGATLIVISGGNIDPELLDRALAAGSGSRGPLS